MSGGLIQLVQINNVHAQYADVRASRAVTYDMMEYEFNNNSILINRTHDISKPKWLLINLPANADGNAILAFINDLLNNWELVLEVGGQNITSIPFFLMNAIEPYQITIHNKIKLAIPFDKVFGNQWHGIPLIGLAFHEVRMKLVKFNNPDTTVILEGKLITHNQYLDSQERRDIAHNTHEHLVKEIHMVHCSSQSNNKEFWLGRNSGGLLGGLVFQITTTGATTRNIRRIKLLLNSHVRFDWDADMLEIMTHQLTPTTLYINPNIDGRGILADIDSNSLNIWRLDNISLVIETDLTAGFNMNTFFIVNNKVRVMSGMMGKPQLIHFNFRNIIGGTTATATPTTTPNQTIAIETNTGSTWQLKPLDFEIPSDAICPITHDLLDADEDGIYKCGCCNNLIGYNAMLAWIASNRSCPLCRSRDINNYFYRRQEQIASV